MKHHDVVNKSIWIITLVLTAFLMSSCATVLDGTKQLVKLESKPKGADIYINGMPVDRKTPCEYGIEKKVPAGRYNSENEYLYAFKKNGYLEKVVRDSSHYEYGAYFFANFFMAWGYLIDYLTGADRFYSKQISVTMEPEYGYIDPTLDKINENEGIIIGEIKFTMGGRPISMFDDAHTSPVGYCQPIASVTSKPSGIGQFAFAVKENDAGYFNIKLPRGTYSLTHLFIPSFNMFFSPFDSLLDGEDKNISKVDTANYINIDVVPQTITYVGSISVDVSYTYDMEYLDYIGYIDRYGNMQTGKLPETGGGELIINNRGQISGMRINTKEYELEKTNIKDNKLIFTYRKKDGESNKFVYAANDFSFRAHWSITNEENKIIRSFKMKYPNISSEIGIHSAQTAPILK